MRRVIAITLAFAVLAVAGVASAAQDFIDGLRIPATLTNDYTFNGGLVANGTTNVLGNARTDIFTVGGRLYGTAVAVTAVSAAYTATATDDVIICNTSGGAYEIALPAVASSTGKVYYIGRSTAAGTNAVTINPNASELIDAAATFAELDASGDAVTIVCTGTEWIIVGEQID